MSREAELREIALREIAEEELAQEEEASSGIPDQAGAVMAAVANTPGAKQIGAGISTAIDYVFDDDEVGSISERYQRNLGRIHSYNEEMKEKAPVTYYGTDMANKMLQSTVAGPARVMAQSGLAGIQSLTETSGSGRSVIEQAQIAAGNSALGGAFTVLGNKAGSMYREAKSKLGKLTGDLADRSVVNTVDPGESKTFIKKTNNLIESRYKSDIKLAAKHADEIINLEFALTPRGIAENAKTMKTKIGRQIGESVDYLDDVGKTLKVPEKDGGILQAELKHAVGGKSRYVNDLPDVLKNDFVEIDKFIDDITLLDDTTMKHVLNKVEKPDLNTGGKVIDYVPGIEKDVKRVSRKFGVGSLFNVKVNLAHKIDDLFDKKMAGMHVSASKMASLKEQKARIVGKLGEVIDRQMNVVASNVDDPDTLKLLGEFKEANQKYALANHLERSAYNTLIEQNSSAKQWAKSLVSFKGVMLGTAMGIASGNPAVTGGIMLSQAALNMPSTGIKVARKLQQFSQFMQKNPSHPLTQQAVLALRGNLTSEEVEKEIAGMVGEMTLMSSALARDTDSVKRSRDTIGSVIRRKQGDEAADAFHNLVESGDEDAIGAFMDGLSKMPDTKDLVEKGMGWNGKVYDQQDKASLAEGIKYDLSISRSQRNKLINDLMENGTMPQPQPEQPTMREWRQRNKRVSEY